VYLKYRLLPPGIPFLHNIKEHCKEQEHRTYTEKDERKTRPDK
jgi:hypothetical protein